MRRFVRWAKYVLGGTWPVRWQDRIFTGHISFFGGRFVLYGSNAMHWAVNVWFRGAWWCFHPTTRTFGARWPWYFYISRDATPFGATFRLPRRSVD